MTPQQRKIITHIETMPGLTAKQIARLINSTPATVEVQLYRIAKSGRLGGLVLANGYVLRSA